MNLKRRALFLDWGGTLVVTRENQRENDEHWAKLSEGGSESVSGWLKDKYGLSWQITPTALGEMLKDEDTEKSERVMAAMLTMRKIDLETLERAYQGTDIAVAGASR